ncbi:hypothetical protein LLB_0945 [Legionella longbeachae D-4968]|nr:hypothetical protein LLB_0945 [Legionella longbeachae D-4968]
MSDIIVKRKTYELKPKHSVLFVQQKNQLINILYKHISEYLF